MAEVLNLSLFLYPTPAETLIQYRAAFYSIQREDTELITDWFCRIRRAIEDCDFGSLGDFLAIDKFFCGLDSVARRWLRKNDAWSADQLFQAIMDPTFSENADTIYGEHRLEVDEILKIELEDIVSTAAKQYKLRARRFNSFHLRMALLHYRA